jgi:ABC-2 type transport system permease protein
MMTSMQDNIPKTSEVLSALLKADFTTQWRNRRSSVLSFLVPVLVLISWKSLVDKLGGAFILSTSITIGLTAIGLMGYSNSLARDRDKGIFQRLRVAPVPTWAIMVSRLTVQLLMIVIMVSAVFFTGFYVDNILMSATGYMLGFIAAVAGAAVYLGLGQAIVGRIKSAEMVSSTTRLVYFLFILVGMFGQLGALGTQIGDMVKWSPYGTVNQILHDSMQPDHWNKHSSLNLLVALGYAVLFSTLGIRWFRWNTR